MSAEQQDLLDICDQTVELFGDRAEAVVTVRRSRDALTRFANSRIHQNVGEEGVSVSVLAVSDGRSAHASGNRVDRKSLEAVVERALAAAKVRPVDPDWPGLAPTAPAPAADHWDDETHDAAPAARAEAVKAFVDAGGGMEAAGYCSTTSVERAFASSSGQRLTGRATSASLDGIQRAPGSDGAADWMSVQLSDLDGAVVGSVAAEKARLGQDKRDLEPGSYEVVLEPRCLANMLLFLAGLGFSAKSVADGTSFVHVGDAQFDPAVSLWDDVTDPRALGVAYDAEGTPKQRVDLVRNGVTTGVLHDRRTAAKAGVTSTGHASGSAAMGPAPSNLFFGEGDRSPEELVRSVERGLLVSDFWYTRILDPKTQVVTGLTRNGVFLIEGGEVVGAVKDMRFTQSFVAALGPGKVLGVGNDAHHVLGRHVPTVHLAQWNFTGGAKG